MNEVIKFIENKYDLSRKLVKGVPWGGSGAEHAIGHAITAKRNAFINSILLKHCFTHSLKHFL